MRYKLIEINLASPSVDVLVDFGGEYGNFRIVHQDSPFSYRINSVTADKLPSQYIEGHDRDGIFKCLYVTIPAGLTGKALIYAFD